MFSTIHLTNSVFLGFRYFKKVKTNRHEAFGFVLNFINKHNLCLNNFKPSRLSVLSAAVSFEINSLAAIVHRS